MKFRKLLSATLAFMLAVSATPAVLGAEDTIDDEIYEAELAEEAELFAVGDTFESGVFTYEIITTKNVKIIAVSEKAAGVTVPATVKSGSKTYNVTEIADGAGAELPKATFVNLATATNLTYIGENCFSYCPLLATLTFPKTTAKIEEIGNNAFYYCPTLTKVENTAMLKNLNKVGSSVLGLSPYMNSQVDENVILGNVLVKYNGSDTDVTVPDGITAIADAYFGKPIVNIDLNDVTYIGNNAFYGCRELLSIELSASVTEIGDMAFSGCTSLKSVTYGDGLVSVGFCAFANCSALESFKYTGSRTPALTDIGECAFWNCRRLYYLDTGAIENVSVGSFWNCFGETPDEVGGVYYYKLPETVKTIAEGGYGNLWFAYVAIPDSVEAIASTAFGATDGAIYVTGKGTLADEFFTNSGYSSINYGDMDGDGTIKADDIRKVATYIAQDIAAKCAAGTTIADKDVLNYDFGKGVIADINGDGKITTADLARIFQSIKADYEAAQ